MLGLDDEVLVVAHQWVAKAESDLRNAAHTVKLKTDCPTDTVCFHVQQCVEKYLKALLISLAMAFPKTHDLVLLFNLAASQCELGFALQEVQPLNGNS